MDETVTRRSFGLLRKGVSLTRCRRGTDICDCGERPGSGKALRAETKLCLTLSGVTLLPLRPCLGLIQHPLHPVQRAGRAPAGRLTVWGAVAEGPTAQGACGNSGSVTSPAHRLADCRELHKAGANPSPEG